MPLKAILLIVLSSLLQAFVNLHIKGSQRKIAFMTTASLISIVFYLPLFKEPEQSIMSFWEELMIGATFL
jgi:hypothetical protein